MKYIIQINTQSKCSSINNVENKDNKNKDFLESNIIPDSSWNSKVSQVNKEKSNHKFVKNINDFTDSYVDNYYSDDNDNNYSHGNSMKEIVEDIEKIIDHNSSIQTNIIDEFINHPNFKQISYYLEKYKIKNKYSITANGFILNCSPRQLGELIKFNKNIINLVVKDIKIALHQPLPADSYNKINPKFKQWSIDSINVKLLWEEDVKGQNTLIAIFDTGVDKSHCQLKDNYSGIWKDFVNEDYETENEPYDDNGHGTLVCGIACGSNVNDFIVGAAPEAKWMCCKILNDGGGGNFSSFIEACDYLIMKGIYPDAINCSFKLVGGDEKIIHNYNIITENIINILESYNIFVCFSAGNTGTTINYPSCLSKIFSVGAFDSSNKFASFNCYSADENITKPDIVGPGVNILSCVPKIYLPDDNGVMLYDSSRYKYCMFSGTSFASAYVCGSISLIVQSLNRKGIRYDIELVKDLLTQHLFTLFYNNNKSNYVIDDLYCRELGKHKLNISSTITKLICESNKYPKINDKYMNHPIKGIIKPVPKLDRSTINSLHPKYPYLNLLWIYYCFENK